MQLINLINQSKIICTIANSVSNAALISSFLYLSLKRTPLIVLSTAISNTCIQPMFIQSSNDPRSRVIQQDVHQHVIATYDPDEHVVLQTTTVHTAIYKPYQMIVPMAQLLVHETAI